MLAGSHRNAWPDETGTGGRTNRNTQLENMILDYYEYNDASSYVDFEVKKLFEYVQNNIFNAVSDPKGIQGNLNNLSFDEKISIYTRASADFQRAQVAIANELNNPSYAINQWRVIFGNNFPTFG